MEFFGITVSVKILLVKMTHENNIDALGKSGLRKIFNFRFRQLQTELGIRFFDPCLIDFVIFGPKGKRLMMNLDILFLTSFLKAR